LNIKALRVISVFRRSLSEISALLGCYTARIGSKLSTFRENLSVTFLKVKLLDP